MLQPIGLPRNDAPGARPPEKSETEVMFNPQDKVVLPHGSTRLRTDRGLSTDRVRVEGRVAPAGDGTYVFPEGDDRQHAALSFATVVRTLETFEKALGQKIPWAFRRESIDIHPDEGQMLNAYYSRDDGALVFFHEEDPVTGKTVHSGDSGEVVAHEAAHAILDGLRPGYLGAWSPDPGAFHESFGDCMAILMSMQDDRVLDKVVEETGGDLSRPNLVAHNGENMGIVINHRAGKNVTGGDYGRTARNDFKWADPSTLPHRGGPDQLGSEVHSFSRLWTGAFYDVLKELANANMAAGMAPKEALRAAGSSGLEIMAALIKSAPQGDFTYRDLANAMLRGDQRFNGGRYAETLTKVFTERRILSAPEPQDELKSVATVPGGPSAPAAGRQSPLLAQATVPFLSLPPGEGEAFRKVRVTLRGDEFGQYGGAVVENPVDADGSLSKDAEVAGRVQKHLKRLIDAGRIKWTEPGQKVETRDLFDAEGRPYAGVVRWEDGQMKIERVKIAT